MNRTEFEEITIPLITGKICGRWYGNQQERPILALHGWGDNAGTFTRLAPLIANQIPILAVDLPGHGLSESHLNGIKYNFMDFVRMVREIMIYYKWPKLSLMGHSLGTGISYLVAALLPGSIDIIISIDGFTLPRHKLENQLKLIEYSTEAYFQANEKIMDRKNKNIADISYSYEQLKNMLYQATGKSVNLENTKYLLERKIKPSANEIDKFYLNDDRCVKFMERILLSDEFQEVLASRIRDVKWLILKSESSTVLNVKQFIHIAEILTNKNPLIEFYVLPNTTHHLHLNNPQLVANYINMFLETTRAAELMQETGKL